MQRHFVTCPLCECMCGLQVDVEDEHVKLIRGDRDDVWSKGYLCPKGTTLGHLHDDPDRIREPMVRDGDTWREVVVGRGVRAVRGADPRRARPPRHRRRHRVRRQPGRPQLHARPLHAAVHRPVGHAAHLLVGHHRPVAQERLVHPHVREHVEDPGARHPAHRLPDLHGRQPAGVGRLAARVPRRPRRARRHPRRAAARSSSSTRAAPAPPTTPTSGCRSSPAPTPRSCSRCATCSSPRGSRRSARSRRR